MQKNDRRPANRWLRLSNLAFQMLALIASGAYLGTWIDRKFGGYWASIICSLVGVAFALYLAIKEAIKMGNES